MVSFESRVVQSFHSTMKYTRSVADMLGVGDRIRVVLWANKKMVMQDLIHRDETLENLHAAIAVARGVHPSLFELDVEKTGFYTSGKTVGEWGRKVLHININEHGNKKIKIDIDPIDLDEAEEYTEEVE